ncbi:glycylpeptide N-tetradecanoyltransferase 2-like [Ruditapes philippinarum]|uniref:glycylpeptide N-tetradecanoyltransferase 2-like n=1 Tax=Ruditapes philippinarum TaxID=129788 RepID=UPI00295BDA6A|nr:glycylpeptide N-tetradecanoyltransferase 2-like [Ruditapes philippinarum]
MADGDSLYELSSDQDGDPDAIDGDVENDDTADDGVLDAARKKSKKKKLRRPRGIEKSSGDSDSQTMSEDQDGHESHHYHHHHHHDGHTHQMKKKEDMNHMSGSGAEADTEGQGSQMEYTPRGKETKTVDEEKASGDKAQPAVPALSRAQIQKTVKELEMLSMVAGAAPKSMDEAAKKRYQFWETQPVPRINEKVQGNEEIEQDKPTDEIRQDTYSLPQGFRWDTLDISDPLILKELYTLLNENYVEDDDNMFRFDYSPEFLQWALQPPGWLKDWHCGVRVIKSGKLVGFISAVPAHIKIYDKDKHMVEINFLCVHKKLRSKRVAPVLIREITRRVHLKGLFQAVYTAGVVLPKPVACCRYWHRSLNPKKLIEVKFSHLTRNMTMQRTLKLYKLPDTTKVPGFRPFTPADVTDTFKLLSKYLLGLDLAPVFTEEEFRHWFIPRKGIIDSYVVENNGVITDFVSFYTFCTLQTGERARTPATGFDVFNALDLMQNKTFLEKLKFGIGDGNLQYYLYNWRCSQMEPNQVGNSIEPGLNVQICRLAWLCTGGIGYPQLVQAG